MDAHFSRRQRLEHRSLRSAWRGGGPGIIDQLSTYLRQSSVDPCSPRGLSEERRTATVQLDGNGGSEQNGRENDDGHT